MERHEAGKPKVFEFPVMKFTPEFGTQGDGGGQVLKVKCRCEACLGERGQVCVRKSNGSS